MQVEALGRRADRRDVRAFVSDLLTRVPPSKLPELLGKLPLGWIERPEILLESPVVGDFIAAALPVAQTRTPPLTLLAARSDRAWRDWLRLFERDARVSFERRLRVGTGPTLTPVLLPAVTYNGRTEASPCVSGGCTTRDVRAWRLAARRWLILATELRRHLLEVWGPVKFWPQTAALADLGFQEAEKLLGEAADSLDAARLPVYVDAQRKVRLAVRGYQLGKGGKDFGGLLFELVEFTFGRWGPITGAENRTLGRPCSGVLDVCTDYDVYWWEYEAKSFNGSAKKLREGVTLVFGADASTWPPLVRWGEMSFVEAQEVFNNDLGWSDSAKVYSFADAQALVKDALEIWSRAIQAKTGKDVDYEAPDPNADPSAIPPPPPLPELPDLPDVGRWLRNLAMVGGVLGVSTVATVYLLRRPK